MEFLYWKISGIEFANKKIFFYRLVIGLGAMAEQWQSKPTLGYLPSHQRNRENRLNIVDSDFSGIANEVTSSNLQIHLFLAVVPRTKSLESSFQTLKFRA